MSSKERQTTVANRVVDLSIAEPVEACDRMNVETSNQYSLKPCGHWFERHSRSDFTRYITIEAKICWSYWTVSKYSHLVEQGRTKEAENFIENNRVNIIRNLHSAGTEIEEWVKAPTDIRTLLEASYQSSKLYVTDTITTFDSINFHQKLGLKKEEPIADLITVIDREQQLMRLHSQHTDNADLTTLYYKWVYVYYDLIKNLNSINDVLSWRDFRRVCWKSLRGTLPQQELIESSAAATIHYLEVDATTKPALIEQFTKLWLRLFTSSAQFNRALLEFVRDRDFPSEGALQQFDFATNRAANIQFDASIMLADLLIDDSLNRLSPDGLIRRQS